MSEQKTDYGEVFCKAVDTILSNRLDKLEFDVTKVCRIIDNTYKKQGKYIVTDDSAKFEAYSTIYDLMIGDNVLVNIPKGDYEKQKTILNKIMQEDDPNAINFKSPLSSLLKFTDNELQPYNNQEYSILANDESEIVGNALITNRTVEIAKIEWSEDSYVPYKRMGVGANFRTWLNSFRTVSGTYGLRFEFFIVDSDGGKKSAHSFDFNVRDMIGNPYNFEMYVHQEKTFDISRVENATELRVILYQNCDFLNDSGQYIPYQSEGDPITGVQPGLLNHNIFVNNLELYFGYDKGAYTKDTLEISVSPNKAYSNIQGANIDKTLKLHWIHKIDDDNFEILDREALASKVYEIYWCRQTLEAKESNLIRSWIGDNWTRYFNITATKEDPSNPFIKIFTPDQTRSEEYIKVVCRLQNDEGEWEQYNSDIITFTNTSYVADKATVNQIMGLQIVCDDKTDGNYFIYNQSGEIINEGHGQGYKRTLRVQFNGLDLNHPDQTLSNIQSITWELPRDGGETSTMLTYKPAYYGEETGATVTPFDNVYKVVRSNFVGNQYQFSTQAYSIKNNWHESNSSNRITCRLVANYTTYERTIELKFGKAGTSGTNITLKLDYADGENALTVDNNQNFEPCTIRATLYDMSGKKIPMDKASGDWSWKWYHSGDNNFINYIHFVKQEYEIQLTKPENFGTILTSNNKSWNDLLRENYHVLEVTYTPKASEDEDESGDEDTDDNEPEDIVSTSLSAYLPIAIKIKGQCDYMEGTRTVLYNAQGTLEHNTYTDAYILFKEKPEVDEIVNATWDITWDNTAKDADGVEQTVPESYRPVLAPLNKAGSPYLALRPSAMYIKGFNDRACVFASDQTGNVLWSQPLLIIQSSYDFPMVNKWTGGTEVGDSTIMATAFSAGRKDKNNKFSGIILGDLEEMLATKLKNTGLFGLLDNKITFSLTDDGVASFGKVAGKFAENATQLEEILNGDKTVGAIQLGGTSNWLRDKERSTVMFDIDNGLLDMVDAITGKGLVLSSLGKYNDNTAARAADTKVPFLQFKNGIGNVPLLNFTDDTSIIQSASAKMVMDLSAETLSFKKDNDNILTFNTAADSKPIRLNNFTMNWDGGFTVGKFQVTSNGTVYYDGKELSALIQELAGSTES